VSNAVDAAVNDAMRKILLPPEIPRSGIA